ncbi:hypothetical protein RFI_35353 [Reticulomyxa filosa]|uniref:Uncharacterized protein n=1 Tax=Reticulomyxa filosa TaxID=46433 RepID=X6LKD9_RETFI|nr:hypothetical protein RFI_35353 [Reticulomyxa filosa]|eukprot:ETO02084.1 hypothetical protein RFI_35353 [Reticulomyxa filosa]
MTLSQLYEILLKSYMKWNMVKLNGINKRLNDDKIFNIFEMEMEYCIIISFPRKIHQDQFISFITTSNHLLNHGSLLVSILIRQSYALERIGLMFTRDPLNKMMEWHLLNFQYPLHHPDIHLFNKISIVFIILFVYSTETLDVVVQYYKQMNSNWMMLLNCSWILGDKGKDIHLDVYYQMFVFLMMKKSQFVITVRTYLQRFHHNWKEKVR